VKRFKVQGSMVQGGTFGCWRYAVGG